MLRKVSALLFLLTLGFTYTVSAKIWRVNNNVGITADFNTFHAAATSATVQPGDTLYMEPTTQAYGTFSFTLTKRLVVIGPGYFLDPANTTFPANPGLQVNTQMAPIAFFRIGPGADGSKFMGLNLEGTVYMNGANNVQFERNYFGHGGVYLESETNNNISVRKCYFHAGSGMSMSGTVIVTNLVIENNVFWGGYMTLDRPAGSGNIFRNNSIANTNNTWTFNNMYVANNIFGTGAPTNFVNCTIKNNLFQTNQVLPGTATNNQVNVNIANVFEGGTTNSLDSRYILKAGSPAIGAGVTVGAVVSPDCGAFGATDPYKLSGIPNIPSIYTLTVPVSIASGATTMNVTLSTRNNQ